MKTQLFLKVFGIMSLSIISLQTVAQNKIQIGIEPGFNICSPIKSKHRFNPNENEFSISNLTAISVGLNVNYLTSSNSGFHTGFYFDGIGYNVDQKNTGKEGFATSENSFQPYYANLTVPFEYFRRMPIKATLFLKPSAGFSLGYGWLESTSVKGSSNSIGRTELIVNNNYDFISYFSYKITVGTGLEFNKGGERAYEFNVKYSVLPFYFPPFETNYTLNGNPYSFSTSPLLGILHFGFTWYLRN